MVKQNGRSNFGKYGVFVGISLIGFLVVQGAVCAHPPSEVSLVYDKASGVLSVTVLHDSDDRTLHYIKDLFITVNGELQEKVPYDWDENEQGVVATYNISAIDGDEIVAEARCSIQGSLLNTIVVGGGGSSTSTPGFEVVFWVGALVIVFLMRKRVSSGT